MTLDWDALFLDLDSIEDMWKQFQLVLNYCVEQFVPKTNVIKPKTPWMNSFLRRVQRRKQNLYKQYKRSCNTITYARYIRCAKYYRIQFLLAKTNYEKKLFGKNNCKKKFYSYVKSQTKCHEIIPAIKTDNGLVDEPALMSELFADAFCKSFTNDNGILPDYEIHGVNKMYKFCCDETMIISAIKKMSNSTALDPQNFCALFVKRIKCNIAKPVNMLLRKSFDQGALPSDWKIAKVTPKHKKGDKQICANYRSISLTSIFCKIAETLIRDQVLQLLETNNLIPKNQHGFMPKRSVTTNLLSCMEDWHKNMDNGFQTDVIYIDFSKCFSSKSHQKLLYKLNCIALCDNALAWLRNFLLNRQQYVCIDGCSSLMRYVKSGYPEGSVTGPIFYLCYSLDMYLEIINSILSTFADDSKLYRCIKSTDDHILLQNDFDNIVKWTKEWQLNINASKTKVLVVGKTKFVHCYKLGELVLEIVSSIRDLGVIIQSSLTFTLQTNDVVKRAFHVIRQIFMNFKNHDILISIEICMLYVRPILESCSQIWNPWLKFNSD